MKPIKIDEAPTTIGSLLGKTTAILLSLFVFSVIVMLMVKGLIMLYFWLFG